MFILASSACKSLQYVTSALTQGGEGGHLFQLTCSIVLRGGRNTANKYHWRVCGVLIVSQPHWVCPLSQLCAFSVYTAQAPGCSAGELSKVGPGLRALPRSMLLRFRFRFSGTPQRHRLCRACVLYPSQVRAAQVTRCLPSALSSGTVSLITSSVPAAPFLCVQWEHCLSSTVCLLWRACLWLQPFQQM